MHWFKTLYTISFAMGMNKICYQQQYAFAMLSRFNLKVYGTILKCNMLFNMLIIWKLNFQM